MGRHLTNTVVVVFGLVAVLAASSVLNADVIVLKDGLNGYTGTRDTYLKDGSSDDNNYGGWEEMEVMWRSNERDAVIRFDLSPLPSSAVITWAKLRIYYFKDIYMTSTDYLDVAVYPLRRSWTEGNGGEDGQGGDQRTGASWLYRHAHPDPTTWGNGGAHNVPNDRDAAYDDDARLYGETFGYVTWESQLLTSTVAEWYAGTANNGWVVDYTGGNEDTQGVYFYSREYVSSSFRPKLEITYTVVPEPATMTLLGLGLVTSLFSRRKNRG